MPLQCDEGDDYQAFRLGLFGLDKLKDVDAAVKRFENALKQVVLNIYLLKKVITQVFSCESRKIN